MRPRESDHRNLFIAMVMCTAIVAVWYVIDMPRHEAVARWQQQQAEHKAKAYRQQLQENRAAMPGEEKDETAPRSRAERIAGVPRVRIDTPKLHGSLSLLGGRIDDLTLARYRVEPDPAGPEVTLLSPAGDAQAYFAQSGWLADGKVTLPDDKTMWKADRDTLRPGEPVTLRWQSPDGLVFTQTISVDTDYMFTIRQQVENRSGRTVTLRPFGLLNRSFDQLPKNMGVLHEGPIGVFSGILEEVYYDGMQDKPKQQFTDASGWLGFSDKYWLTSLVPGKDEKFTANFGYYQRKGRERFQADFMGEAREVPVGGTATSDIRLFAGAKELKVLDRYADGRDGGQPILLFDRAVDFGTLYFLTRPLFLLLTYFFALAGNFGIAILLLTVVVKFFMFPLANKAYKATSQMRELQPEMQRLRALYGNDKLRLNQEMMTLYKREKVNPASGCVPVLIQIPVFFALYKVLLVSIEMRHAPFFWWIKDLSAADPTNFFTLLGLIPWDPPALLHVGVLPLLMTLTMVVQMRQQPTPPDPVQAKVIKFMPWFFLVLFASFPAGLVLYWVWSNILSIAQQWLITTRHKTHRDKVAAKAKNLLT